MRSMIPYYGGKARLAPKIVEIISTIDHNLFVEPYFGGGSVFFAKGKQKGIKEVINDWSEDLTNMYKFAIANPQEFMNRLMFTPYHESLYDQAYEILKNPEGTLSERAWAYYVVICQSFNARIGGGWKISKSKSAPDNPLTWNNRKARLPDCLDRLNDAFMTCQDALDCIRRWDTPNTLFYLDPPYPGAYQGHYKGFTQQDWQDLLELLEGIEGKFILSNYDDPLLNIDTFCDKVWFDTCTTSELNSRSKKTEVLWIRTV